MKNERGFSLIEVLVALALLGIIAVAFLGGLATASKAIFIADERATAESLARSQMEDVKKQPYDTAPDDGEAAYNKTGDIPEGYTIWSVNRDGYTVNGGDDEKIIGVPWDSQTNQPVTIDAGLQKITLLVKHHGKEIFTFIRDDKKITLEDYKVNR